MTVTLHSAKFDKIEYDREADVLYMSVQGAEAVRWEESPEGHVLRFDEHDELIGITFVNAMFLFHRDGSLRVTLPQHKEEVPRGDVEMALAGC
jgi:uncharacterized protein YuzE